MKCPKCNALMIQVGIPELKGNQLFVEWECPVCHYRIQLPAVKQKKPEDFFK